MTEETEVAKKAPEENRTVVRTQEVKKTFVMGELEVHALRGVDLEILLDRLWMMGRLERIHGGAETQYAPNPSWLELR